jgi:hypothetical protein
MNRAKNEFLKLGYKPVEQCEDGPNKWIQECVLELLKIFSDEGHSGGSAPYAVGCFKKLAKFESIEDAKKEFIKMGYKPIEECEDDPDKWIQEGVLKLLETFLKFKRVEIADKIIEYFATLAMNEPLAPILCTDDEWNDTSDTWNGGDSHFQNNRLSSIFKEGKDGKPYYLDAIVWKNQKGITYTGGAFNSKGEKIKSMQAIKLPFQLKTFYIDVFDYEIGPDDWESKIVDESQLEEVWKYYENPIREKRKEKLNKIEET